MFISMHITCTTNRARFSILFDFFLLHLALRFDFFFSNPNQSLMNKAEQIMNSVCVRCCVCVRSLWSPSLSCATVRSQPLLFTLIETQTFKIEHKWRFNQRKIVCDHELLLVFFLLKQSIWWWLDWLSFLCYSVAFIHPHKHFSTHWIHCFALLFTACHLHFIWSHHIFRFGRR